MEDAVAAWLKKNTYVEGFKNGTDPRGPTPDGTFHWYYSYQEKKWIRYVE
jgi:hypothetical protein